MRGLKGKRAIVTGGAQGIGHACVEEFIRHGCSVVISDIEEDTGLATQKALNDAGADIHFIQGDMQDESFCVDTVNFAVEKMGGVDQVIHMPVPNITSCTFGGANLDTLYITTARILLSDEALAAHPLAGSLFSFKPGVKGLPVPLFRG